jgi:ATP-dependent Lon protease
VHTRGGLEPFLLGTPRFGRLRARRPTPGIPTLPSSTVLNRPRFSAVPMPRGQRKEEILRAELPPTLPLMALRSTIVFPLGTIAVQMGAPENLALLRAHEESGLIVALVVAGGEQDDPIDMGRFVGKVGVAARVHERINLPGDTIQITLQGLRRITIEAIEQSEPYAVARILGARESAIDLSEAEELVARTIAAAESMSELIDRIPAEVPQILKMNGSDPGRFADLAATNMNLRIADKDNVLQRLDVADRLQFVLAQLEKEVARARVMEDVKRQTEVKIEQHQREFYLRQQLRAIQSELGERDPQEKESTDLVERLEAANLPPKVLLEAKRECERLKMLSPASSEFQVLRTYLDWVLALPWTGAAPERDAGIVLDRVDAALGDRHYGLHEAKERILEYLAVRKLRGGDPQGPILCFVGPPGTGKTSLGAAIATSIGREFYRISVGGVRDEAEIRGHRRTYVGAMPGLLLQALRRVGTRDPVIMIDEIDKMTAGGPSGDPTAAMLEVLDPSQNDAFVDHYLNLPFDLSQVLFICTANNLFDIPGPLRDRMEVIRIAGYTVEEKVEIANRYLLPRLLADHGLDADDFAIDDTLLSYVASRYSREAGLRNFERNLAALMRKRARRKAEGETGRWVIDVDRVEVVLGGPRYAAEAAELEPEIGAVTGLAWTATGGDLMNIETLTMPGSGKLTVTGQLGDVMRESVDAAFSYVRSRARTLGIEEKEFRELDLHLHFPAGSVPKDGPSAGVAVTLALASALAKRPVRRDVAMTGEVTLRGKVLEIGGVKEKTLAAYRAGLREVIMPKANEKDLRDIPDEIRRTMVFTFVSTMDEVLRMTLLGAPEPLADRAVVELPGRTMGTPRSVGTIPLRPITDGGAAAIAGSVRLRPGFQEPRPRMLAEPNDPLDLSVLFQDEL